jgi:Tol biopolymer transport system component
LTESELVYREVHLSYDSSRIVYSAKANGGGAFRIETSHADGSNPQVVLAIPGRDLVWPRLNPQGNTIIHNKTNGGNVELWMVDIDGTDQRLAIAEPGQTQRWSSWSHDGTQIACISSGGTDTVRVFQVDPALDYAVTGGPDIVVSQPGTDLHYVEWQPTLDPYLLILDRNDPPNCFYVRASNPSDRIDVPVTPTSGSASIGTWSPDGTQILYGTRNDGLYVIDVGDATGATRRKVLDGPVDFPVWR